MNFKQKLVYMGVGFLFASMGYMLANYQNAVNAQDPPIQPQVIDQVICRRLRIVDTHGRTVLELHGRNEHGGQIGVYSQDGRQLFAAGADAMGGIVVVQGNEPNHIAVMAMNRHGGHVSVGGGERSGAGLRTNERGGQLIIAESGGQEVVFLGVDEDSGGSIEVFGKSEDGMSGLGINESGGFVVASGTDGESSVGMFIDDEEGGIVRATGKTAQQPQ